MAGVTKVFQLGPLEHARKYFLPYADTFLPVWSLWATGVIIPFVELVSGGLIMLGLRTREALVSRRNVFVEASEPLSVAIHRISGIGRFLCRSGVNRFYTPTQFTFIRREESNPRPEPAIAPLTQEADGKIARSSSSVTSSHRKSESNSGTSSATEG